MSPSTLRLKTGQSATFEVTITDKSAPVDVWKFGSLTWKDRLLGPQPDRGEGDRVQRSGVNHRQR